MSDNAYLTRATRQSCPNARPLPAEHARLVVERAFTEQEYARIEYGVIAYRMEDRWFIFLEDTTLFFHRSWTGYCIFQVSLAQQGTTYAIANVLVNRDPTQYSGSSDSHDTQLLLWLINHLILGGQYLLPPPSGVPADIATDLYYHQTIGAGHNEPKVLELKDLWSWFWAWLWWLIKPRRRW